MRTVITGLGIICAIGNNQHEVFSRIQNAQSGIDLITLFDHSPFDCKFAAEVKQYDPKNYFSEQELPLLNRCSQFSIIAIKEALAQAHLDLNTVNSYEVGLCLGTSQGATEEFFKHYKVYRGIEKGGVTPAIGFKSGYYGLLKILASYLGINGVSFLTSIACASGANAVGIATDLIRHHKAKYVLCGGSDGFDLSTFAGFWGLGAVSPKPTAPFSTGTPGITLGEGAAYFVIESLETARERNANILGEVLGYALTNDAHHATAPHPQGMGALRCMQRAITHSGICKEDIEYINAHGTGTEANDLAEKNAIIALYEDNVEAIPPISATKTFTGHATGAAGAIELAISMLGVKHGILPPTLNFEESRFKDLLDFLPNTVRKKKIQTFLSNSFAFAGCNVAIVAGEFDKTRHFTSRPNSDDRVVISGIGGVCSVGIGKEAIWKAFEDRKTNLSQIDMFDVSARCSTHASLIPNFNPRKYARRIDTRRMDRISQLATVAAFLCLQDAYYKVAAKNGDKIGVIYNVAPGPMLGRDKHVEGLVFEGPDHPSQIYFPYAPQNSSLGHITINLGIKGHSTNLVEGSGALGSVICAFDAIKRGYQQRIVAGGSDELYWNYHLDYEVRGELMSDDKLGAYSLFSSRPEGYIPGEGAAFLMIEGYEAAKERGAQIYAEILGYGASIDSNKEMLSNDKTGKNLYQAMEMALQEANIDREHIRLVLSSERGIPTIARAELTALTRFFGEHLRNVMYTTTRFNTGWLNSSTSVFNIISLLYAFAQKSILPIPHSNLTSKPNEVTICQESIEASELKYGMVVTISREGTNAAMIFKCPSFL